MLANKNMSIKDTSKPQMLVSFQYKQIIVRSSSSFSSFVFSFGRNGRVPQGGSSCAKFFLKGQFTHYCKFCHHLFKCLLLNTKEDILVTKQLTLAIGYHSCILFPRLWKSIATISYLLVKISYFVLNRRKKLIQVWNNLRMSDYWQNAHF